MSEEVETCPGPGKDGKPCGRKLHGRGLCSGHCKQSRKGEELTLLRSDQPRPPCSIVLDGGEPCPNQARTKGMCRTHDYRQRKGQSMTAPIRGKGVTYRSEPDPRSWDRPEPRSEPKKKRKVDVFKQTPALMTPIDPGMHWDAWRAICHHTSEGLAELAGALGITAELKEEKGLRA